MSNDREIKQALARALDERFLSDVRLEQLLQARYGAEEATLTESQIVDNLLELRLAASVPKAVVDAPPRRRFIWQYFAVATLFLLAVFLRRPWQSDARPDLLPRPPRESLTMRTDPGQPPLVRQPIPKPWQKPTPPEPPKVANNALPVDVPVEKRRVTVASTPKPNHRAAASAPVVIGRIGAVVGEPEIAFSGRKTTLQPKSQVVAGSTVSTGDADQVEIVFNDGTSLRLAYNTTVTIPSGIGTGARRPDYVNLGFGKLVASVEKSRGRLFRIDTPAADALVLGTRFGLSVEDDPTKPDRLKTTLTVQEGTVRFYNAYGSVQAHELTESRATEGSAPSEPKRISVSNVRWISTKLAIAQVPRPMGRGEYSMWLDYPSPFSGLYTRRFPEVDYYAAQKGEIANGPPESMISVVDRVEPNSPAENAGAKVGDVVFEVDGTAVVDGVLPKSPPGSDSRRYKVLRDGKPVEYTLFFDYTENGIVRQTSNDPALADLLRDSVEAFRKDADALAFIERQKAVLKSRDAAAIYHNIGVAYEYREEYAKAARSYKEAIRRSPGNALYRYRLGSTLFNIGNASRAIQEIELATRFEPRWMWGWERLADYATQMGNDALVERAAREMIRRWPRNTRGYNILAEAYLYQGRFEESMALCRQALEQQPDDWMAHQYIQTACRMMGRYEEGLASALAMYRRLPDALDVVATSLSDLKRYSEAERWWRRGLDLDAQNMGAYAGLIGDLQKQERMEEALAVANQQNVKLADFSHTFVEKAHILRKLGRIQESIGVSEQAIQRPQAHYAHYVWVSGDRFEKGKPAEGLRLLDQALAWYLQHPNFLDGAANLARDHGQYREAERYGRLWLRVAPSNRLAWERLALTFAEKDDRTAEVSTLRESIRHADDKPPLQALLALRLADRAETAEEAMKLAQLALKADPKEPRAHHAVGKVHLLGGEKAKALESLEKALAFDKDDLYSTYRKVEVARLYDTLGRKEEALRFYRLVLEAKPKSREVRERIKALER